jgi:nicotinamide-nucleotide amidase
MFPDDLARRAVVLVQAAAARRIRIVTAESCTGGLVSGLLTDVAGSSAVLERGFVAYSNRAKTELLGVSETTLAKAGAVSAQTAAAMATGALAHADATLAVAITGIAGPGGGSPEKPVGLVVFGLARRGASPMTVERRFGDLGRGAVRLAAVDQALRLLEDAVAQDGSPA